MRLAPVCGVKVEVINNKRVAIRRDLDVEFHEEGLQGSRRGRVGGECEEDVSVVLEEVEEFWAGQRGAEGFEFGGEEEEVVVGESAVGEEGGVGFWGAEG